MERVRTNNPTYVDFETPFYFDTYDYSVQIHIDGTTLYVLGADDYGEDTVNLLQVDFNREFTSIIDYEIIHNITDFSNYRYEGLYKQGNIFYTSVNSYHEFANQSDLQMGYLIGFDRNGKIYHNITLPQHLITGHSTSYTPTLRRLLAIENGQAILNNNIERGEKTIIEIIDLNTGKLSEELIFEYPYSTMVKYDDHQELIYYQFLGYPSYEKYNILPNDISEKRYYEVGVSTNNINKFVRSINIDDVPHSRETTFPNELFEETYNLTNLHGEFNNNKRNAMVIDQSTKLLTLVNGRYSYGGNISLLGFDIYPIVSSYTEIDKYDPSLIGLIMLISSLYLNDRDKRISRQTPEPYPEYK